MKPKEIHSPTLASILMIEKSLEKQEEIGKFQLWQRLPRKMMYQTFCTIIDYLEKSGKITINGTRITKLEKEKTKEEKIEIIAPSYIR